MDTLFFLSSKLFWLLLSPATLLAGLIVIAWLLDLSPWRKTGRRLFALCALGTLVIAFVPLGQWLIYPLEQRFEAPETLAMEPEGVIVLGGSFELEKSVNRRQPHLNRHGERLMALLSLADQFPNTRLVFSGGSGVPGFQEVTEADIATQLLTGLGFQTDRVLFERESRNTFENARYSVALVNARQPGNWLLVTSASHMPRAMGVFCRQGFKPQPYPVDFQTLADQRPWFNFNYLSNLTGLNDGLREWIGLLAYRITDKTNRLLPGPDDACPTPGTDDL